MVMASCRGLWVALLVAACCASSAQGQPITLPPEGTPPPPFDCSLVLCSTSYDPVCAPDGYSWVNECIARCSSEVNLNGKFKKGLCPLDPACSCLNEWKPVCDASGKTTHSNACNADCVRAARPFKKGACPDPCAKVPKAYSPVCSKDGKTYHNRQLLQCTGGKFAYGGTCRVCPKVAACLKTPFKPVCGKDRKTYCNSCIARSRKAPVLSEGACKGGTCLPTGSLCMMANSKCCKGLICFGGPVQRAEQVYGTCRSSKGPLPIG